MFHESLKTALIPPDPKVTTLSKRTSNYEQIIPELFPWLQEQWISVVEEALQKVRKIP